MRETDLRQILDLAQAVAAELVAEAVDPAADLTMVERRALVRLSLAVDAKAARAVGIEPRSAEAEAVVMRELMVKVQPEWRWTVPVDRLRMLRPIVDTKGSASLVRWQVNGRA